jgi:hypothetical protein
MQKSTSADVEFVSASVEMVSATVEFISAAVKLILLMQKTASAECESISGRRR